MPIKSLVGKWRGGPAGEASIMTISEANDGKLFAESTGAKGGRAGMYGAKLGQGASLRGYWYDVDNGVTEGNRLACTIIVTVDESGNACTGKYKTKDGGSGEWTATRFNDAMKFARTDGKITTFAYKSKPTFEALTANMHAARKAKLEKESAEVMEGLEPRPWFDGAGGTGYIPGMGIGAEYRTDAELQRLLKVQAEEHQSGTGERLEAQIAILEAKIAKGSGDADALKKKLDLSQRLLKGAKGAEKLKERPAMKPGNGTFHGDGEKPFEYMGSEYMDEQGLRRMLRKADAEYQSKAGERMEAQIAAVNAKIAKGDGDADALKKKLELSQRLLKGAKGAEKLKERPVMKPPSKDATLAEEPAEHMPDAYLSAHDLERKLAKDDEAWEKSYVAKLEGEIPRLQAKIAKGDGDVDAVKKRLDLAGRLLKGALQVPKLKERAAFRGPTEVTGRLSGTVMLHPKNVRAMIRTIRASS